MLHYLAKQGFYLENLPGQRHDRLNPSERQHATFAAFFDLVWSRHNGVAVKSRSTSAKTNCPLSADANFGINLPWNSKSKFLRVG